jgi:dipeptidyl aminopeptidase/acylaminoacyl peptidase
MLPDRDHFLYLAIRGEAADLRVGSLAASTTVSLGPSQSNATYAAGHLLYAQGGSLMAQPFDLATFERRGRPVRLAGSVFLSGQFGAFSSSENGRLVSMPNARPRTQLTSFTRSGAPTRFGLPGAFYNLALSADERYLAVSMDGGEPPNTDIYVLDLLRGDGARRLTTDPRGEFDPVWSPDGSTLVFNSNRSGQYRLMRRLASGDGDDEALFSSETDFTSFSSPTFSPDGRVLLFTAGRGSVTASGGLWFADLPVGDGGLKPFFASPASASGPVFSPDGRWVLYTSNTSGRSEIYLRRFPEATGLVQVSVDGGSAGRWRGDGREIYFLSPDRDLMAVDVAAKGRSMEPGVPRVLFRPGLSVSGGRPFVVTKDGQRFIMAVPEAAAPDPVISLLVNWPARLKQ